MSGETLLQQPTAFSAGFIAGVADLLVSADLICLPPKTKLSDLHDLVIAWTKNSPSRQAAAGTDLVYEILSVRYPCLTKPVSKGRSDT